MQMLLKPWQVLAGGTALSELTALKAAQHLPPRPHFSGEVEAERTVSLMQEPGLWCPIMRPKAAGMG